MQPTMAGEYHPKCAEELLGTKALGEAEFDLTEAQSLAAEWLYNAATVPGVQPKFSLGWEKSGETRRATIHSALGGSHILKLPHPDFPEMCELEALTMNMARSSGLPTVPFGLIRLTSGELAYLTRRVDRTSHGQRIAMEDFCQLSEQPSEFKYRGSHERVAKLLLQMTGQRLIDLVRFYEIALFAWLTGNADMHLKNFSLYAPRYPQYELAPAYDLLPTALLMPDDPEELAITLNGKKNRIQRKDWEQAWSQRLPPRAGQNLIDRLISASEQWPNLIENGFIHNQTKGRFLALIEDRIARIKN